MIKSATLGLGLLLASAAHAQLAYYAEFGTTYSKPAAGTDVGSVAVFTATHKFNDNWRAGTELLTNVNFASSGSSDFSLGHRALRFPVTRSNLNWLGGGWKTAFTTRWNAPTFPAAQQAGGWGSVLFRPAFSNTFGATSVLVRPQVTLALVDRAYQKYTLPGQAVKGNGLFSWAVEFIPSYKINDKMALTLSSSVSQSYTGGAPGAEGAFGTAGLSHEWILDLPVAVGVLNFAVSVANDTKLNKDFNFFDTDSAGYTFYVTASF